MLKHLNLKMGLTKSDIPERNTTLSPGDPAPFFELQDERGKVHNLDQYAGKKLIIFFYPRDLSESCTKQACNLQDNYRKLRYRGFSLLGVSPDNSKTHAKFINKHGFKYHLLADVDKTMLNAYGVWGPKLFFGDVVVGVRRTTFIIDENGAISHIIENVKTKNHWEQILEVISEV